jgi:hypothetical protein
MRLQHADLVEEYYESIKDKYPNLTLKQCNEIVSASFIEARKGIESGEFPTIRLKYFGTFVAYPKRVASILKGYEVMFKEHRITPFNFFKKKEMLEKYLNKFKDEKNKKLKLE